MSPCTNVAPAGMFSRFPDDRSSRIHTAYPSARKRSATWLPMNPAPPVISAFFWDTEVLSGSYSRVELRAAGPLSPSPDLVQPEKIARRLCNFTLPAVLRGLAQSGGRRMQDLVEQLLCQHVDGRGRLRVQVRRAQHALELGLPQLLRMTAQGLDDGHHAAAAVPRHELRDTITDDRVRPLDLAAPLCERAVHDLLEIVDVVQENTVNGSRGRFDVAWQRDVEQEHGVPA